MLIGDLIYSVDLDEGLREKAVEALHFEMKSRYLGFSSQNKRQK